MSVKDIILTILCYCGLKFVDKFIEDNLPNLHYKNLINGFYNYVVPLILMAYIGFLYLQVKAFGNKEDEKNLQNGLIVVAVALILQQALKQNKNLFNKKIPVANGD